MWNVRQPFWSHAEWAQYTKGSQQFGAAVLLNSFRLHMCSWRSIELSVDILIDSGGIGRDVKMWAMVSWSVAARSCFFLCVDGISDCFPLEVHVSWVVMLLCEDFGECEASVVCFPNP